MKCMPCFPSFIDSGMDSGMLKCNCKDRMIERYHGTYAAWNAWNDIGMLMNPLTPESAEVRSQSSLLPFGDFCAECDAMLSWCVLAVSTLRISKKIGKTFLTKKRRSNGTGMKDWKCTRDTKICTNVVRKVLMEGMLLNDIACFKSYCCSFAVLLLKCCSPTYCEIHTEFQREPTEALWFASNWRTKRLCFWWFCSVVAQQHANWPVGIVCCKEWALYLNSSYSLVFGWLPSLKAHRLGIHPHLCKSSMDNVCMF